jgi:hypothetical protein
VACATGRSTVACANVPMRKEHPNNHLCRVLVQCLQQVRQLRRRPPSRRAVLSLSTLVQVACYCTAHTLTHGKSGLCVGTGVPWLHAMYKMCWSHSHMFTHFAAAAQLLLTALVVLLLHVHALEILGHT